MLRINLSPADIEVFLSVAETGSFTRSGAALALSQSAVSTRVQHLEHVLGVPLFHRTTRRVVITDAGERLRVRLAQTMAELSGFLRELDDESHLRRGRVTIGASPTVAAGFLPDVISRFRDDRPEIDIVLLDDFYGRSLDRILRGEVDFAVVPFATPNQLFDFEPLFAERFLLAIPAAHPLAKHPVINIRQLAGESLVTMPPESAAWNTFNDAFAAAGLAFNPAFQTRNPLTLIAMVKARFGIGFLAGLMAKSVTLDGIVLVSVQDADLGRQVGIVTARGRILSTAAKALCAAMKAAAPPVPPRSGSAAGSGRRKTYAQVR